MRKAVSVLFAAVLARTGCGGTAGNTGTKQKINYLTSFNTFGRDAYAYVAQEKGFFEQAGAAPK